MMRIMLPDKIMILIILRISIKYVSKVEILFHHLCNFIPIALFGGVGLICLAFCVYLVLCFVSVFILHLLYSCH